MSAYIPKQFANSTAVAFVPRPAAVQAKNAAYCEAKWLHVLRFSLKQWGVTHPWLDTTHSMMYAQAAVRHKGHVQQPTHSLVELLKQMFVLC